MKKEQISTGATTIFLKVPFLQKKNYILAFRAKVVLFAKILYVKKNLSSSGRGEVTMRGSFIAESASGVCSGGAQRPGARAAGVRWLLAQEAKFP